MNWEAIGAIGEIVGAVAVVLSLVYLALQLRQQNIESKEFATHTMVDGFRNSVRAFADPETASLYAKANDKDAQLSETELLRLYVIIADMIRFAEEAYGLYLRDRVDEETWQGMDRQYRVAFREYAVHRFWQNRRSYYTSSFQEYMDGIVGLPEQNMRRD
jgi:hypothetical protein